jgi:hypothetical protein
MSGNFTLRSDLAHDGDGCVRYGFSARSESFSAATETWGGEREVAELAALLEGFQISPQSHVEYSFGAPDTGACALRFETADRIGHCRLWVSLTSEVSVGYSEGYERATICIPFVPAMLDRFSSELRGFLRNRKNCAVLDGDAV